MKEYLKKLPTDIQDLIHLASKIGTGLGMPVYLVGGFVRDLILGVSNLDLDIAVGGDGIRFAERLSKELNSKIVQHRRFGTATVVLNDSLKIDISTTRKETYPHPGSLPIVRQGDIKDDMYRRDFTINAMAISINQDDFGRLIDYHQARLDLEKKKIRVLHNISFIDDPTRILRAVRFEQRYNFRIETKTLKLLKEAVRQKMLNQVDPQRLRDELVLILKEKFPVRQIRRLKELVGLEFIHPKVKLSPSVFKFLQVIRKQTDWFKATHPHRRAPESWLIYLMGLIDKLSIREAENCGRKFALRKGEIKRITVSKRMMQRFIGVLRKSPMQPDKLYHLLEPLSYEGIIYLKARCRQRNIQKNIEDFLKNYHGLRLSITGDDLKMLGIVPGPEYQGILKRVLKAKLKGQARGREEELLLAKRIAERV